MEAVSFGYNNSVMTSATSSGNPDKSTSDNTHRKVAGATGIMMLAILASRLLGLVREAVISGQFGQSKLSDVYYAAFILPDLLFFLIAGGALSSAFIPVFTEKITQGKDNEAWHVFSTVACVMFVVVSLFVLAGEIFTLPLVSMLNFGFERDKVIMAVPLTRIVLPAQLCFFLGGLFMGTQYAQNRFVIPSLGPIIYNVGIILGGLVLARFLGVSGLCWGALIGAIVGNFALQLWAIKREGMQFSVSFDWKNPDVMKVWKLMLPVVLGLALPQVSIMVNRMFATSLANGSMSAISRANQLMQVPLGVFGQAMAVAIFPTLAAFAARGELAQMRSTASTGIRNLLFLTIPSSVLMIVLARPLVQLLLQHGKFHAVDTPMCAKALAFYSIGIFAWSAQSILSRAYYAMQDTITPVVIGTGITALFIPMNWLFMTPLHMGYVGLCLATTVAAILHMVVMQYVLARRLHGFETKTMMLSLIRILAASALAGCVAWYIRIALDAHFVSITTGQVKLHSLLTLLICSAAGVVVYAVSAWLLKADELHTALRMFRRRRLA